MRLKHMKKERKEISSNDFDRIWRSKSPIDFDFSKSKTRRLRWSVYREGGEFLLLAKYIHQGKQKKLAYYIF